MPDLLAGADEVHTLTSLAGFEALLRAKPVTCYGRPFYAGWGLTTDIERVPRRGRRLSLDELTAAALILYPTYLSATTNAYTTPERVIDEILARSARLPDKPAAFSTFVRLILRTRNALGDWRAQQDVS